LIKFHESKIVAQQGFKPSQRVLSTKNTRLISIFMKSERFLPKILVLNCEINTNVAHFLYWCSAYYASLNGSEVV